VLTGRPLHTLQFRLAFGECDPAGIIYYATYLEWAERAHGEWWYMQGRPIGELDVGPRFVVRRVACDYLSAPRPYDLISCAMFLQAIGRTSFGLSFSFSSTDSDTVVANLVLTAVFVDAAMSPCSVPDDARTLLTTGVHGAP